MTYEEQYFKQTNEQKLKAQHMDTIKATLDGTPVIQQDAVYLVDWTKLKDISEMITILAAIGFSFSPQHPQFKNIQHLLDLERPIQIGNPQQVGQAQEKKIDLPKLKVIKKDGE